MWFSAMVFIILSRLDTGGAHTADILAAGLFFVLWVIEEIKERA